MALSKIDHEILMKLPKQPEPLVQLDKGLIREMAIWLSAHPTLKSKGFDQVSQLLRSSLEIINSHLELYKLPISSLKILSGLTLKQDESVLYDESSIKQNIIDNFNLLLPNYSNFMKSNPMVLKLNPKFLQYAVNFKETLLPLNEFSPFQVQRFNFYEPTKPSYREDAEQTEWMPFAKNKEAYEIQNIIQKLDLNSERAEKLKNRQKLSEPERAEQLDIVVEFLATILNLKYSDAVDLLYDCLPLKKTYRSKHKFLNIATSRIAGKFAEHHLKNDFTDWHNFNPYISGGFNLSMSIDLEIYIKYIAKILFSLDHSLDSPLPHFTKPEEHEKYAPLYFFIPPKDKTAKVGEYKLTPKQLIERWGDLNFSTLRKRNGDVNKRIDGIAAVQTLSFLNRTYPSKGAEELLKKYLQEDLSGKEYQKSFTLYNWVKGKTYHLEDRKIKCSDFIFNEKDESDTHRSRMIDNKLRELLINSKWIKAKIKQADGNKDLKFLFIFALRNNKKLIPIEEIDNEAEYPISDNANAFVLFPRFKEDENEPYLKTIQEINQQISKINIKLKTSKKKNLLKDREEVCNTVTVLKALRDNLKETPDGEAELSSNVDFNEVWRKTKIAMPKELLVTIFPIDLKETSKFDKFFPIRSDFRI